MRSSWALQPPEFQEARAKVYAESFPGPSARIYGTDETARNSPWGIYIQFIAPVNNINHCSINLPLERFRESVAVLGTGQCLLLCFKQSGQLLPLWLPFPLSLAGCRSQCKPIGPALHFHHTCVSRDGFVCSDTV